MKGRSDPDLAINGGTPVRRDPMPPRQSLGDGERRSIEEALDYYRSRGQDPVYQGFFEKRYCAAFTDFMGGGYADAVATGTAALFVALAALELPRGSEVLVSPITDPGTLSAVVLNGLRPKLLDSRQGSFNTGPEEVAARISDKTSAVVLVHSIGQPADADAVAALTRARDIRLLEDCSQAHGACLEGSPVGIFGDVAAFSTMYRKASITGASGGVVYSRSEEIYHRALAHADRGKPSWRKDFDDRDPSHFLHPALNLHTDDISCAIGIASLRRLPGVIKARLNFVREVSRLVEEECTLCRPYGYTEGDSPFIYPILVDRGRISGDKTFFAEAVRAEGIGLNPHYRYLAADWPFLRPYLADPFDCPNAREMLDSCFCLYLNENYGTREAEEICHAIRKVESSLGTRGGS